MASTSPKTGSRSEQGQRIERSSDFQKAGNSGSSEPSTVGKSASGLKARKRTKTGCLTCRKRRIKCGEERPTCKNCTKSKRECEGYIPKVVFKDQVYGPRPSVGISPRNNPYIQRGLDSHGAASVFGNMAAASADGLPLAPLAPRPPLYGRQAEYLPTSEAEVHPGSGQSYTDTGYAYDNQSYPTSAARPGAQQVQHMSNAYITTQNDSDRRVIADSNDETIAYSHLRHPDAGESDSGIDMGQPDGWSHSSAFGTAYSAHFRHPYPSSPVRSPTSQTLNNVSPNQKCEPSYAHFTHQMPGQPFQSPFPLSQFEDYHSTRREAIPQGSIDPQAYSQYQTYGFPSAPVNWEGETADDWFDVDSDEENADVQHHLGKIPPSDLGMMIHMSANQNKMNVRSMTNFLNEPNVLATYHPSYAASPLIDPQTARVFCHFITATAPTLNVCNRHPSNPSVIFSGRPVPRSQRALWSYTMPMLALHHQGLLHAMLALASLHIAKLQQGSPTPSLRHYHYALRRVAKSLGNPKKRRDVGTLAATLLLGFYEVTTAEHNKWNSHLSGARELISDIDFAKMARRIDAHRTRQEEAEANDNHMQNWYNHGYDQTYSRRASDDLPARSDRKLDEDLIGTIMGWKTRYNEYGQIIDDSEPSFAPDEPLTPGDVENFEIQCDLFWWYAKQDMYQSIISGNRLLLSYDRWGHCPPRAPVGRLDAVYGSMDHLYLLMGRLADFAAKDSSRKRRAAMEAEKRSKAQAQFQHQASPPTGTIADGQDSQPNPSPMYGMIPDPGPVRLPSGFDQAQHDRLYRAPTPSEIKSLSTSTADAEREWLAIQHAFDTYHASLGPSYAPLSAEHMTPTATPFGPAIYYRSYPVACVLTLYYCGRIILTRSHPSMPPAAMAAAGVAAPQTAHHANTIGRICAGIQPVSNTAPLNPHHGAALMDACMGLFHAGVQYRDPAQRGWTITKLRDIARLTGWQTSALIASGCERAWIRAAEMGRGPLYERTMNKAAKDDRVAGRSRDPKVLAEPPKDNNDRRFVHRNAGTRVYWAMGILSVEEDMLGEAVEGLNLGGQ